MNRGAHREPAEEERHRLRESEVLELEAVERRSRIVERDGGGGVRAERRVREVHASGKPAVTPVRERELPAAVRDREADAPVAEEPVSRIRERAESVKDVRVALGLQARGEGDRVVARDEAEGGQKVSALPREETGGDREREVPVRDGRGIIDRGRDVGAEPHRGASERDGAAAERGERHLRVRSA